MTHDCPCKGKDFLEFVGLSAVVLAAIVVMSVCAKAGPWYAGWLLGTPMICLIAGAGAAFLDVQEAHALAAKGEEHD